MLHKIGEIAGEYTKSVKSQRKSPGFEGRGCDWHGTCLESHHGGTFRADAAFDGFGHREFAPAPAATSFVVDFNLFGKFGGVVDIAPEPSETLCTGGFGGDATLFGFGVNEFALGGDETEVSKIIFVVGTGHKRNEMWGFRPGLAHFESEPDTGLSGRYRESGVSGEGESFGLDHGGRLPQHRGSCQAVSKLFFGKIRRGLRKALKRF